MVGRTSRTILFMLALSAASFMFLKTIGTLAQKRQDETRSSMRWEQSDDGLKVRVEIQGKAEFTEDYTDIRDVLEGGYVRIEEDRHGQSRRYEVRRSNNGQLQRTYYLNGEGHSLDQEARNWL